MRLRYSAIDQLEEEDLPVALLCETLGVNRSAYYAWRQHALNQREQDDQRLMPKIRDIFWEHKRRYGARRISEELAARQEPCSRRRVGRLMDRLGLAAIQPRSFKPRTTDSRHTLGYNANLLLDAAPPDAINQLWVGDIRLWTISRPKSLRLASDDNSQTAARKVSHQESRRVVKQSTGASPLYRGVRSPSEGDERAWRRFPSAPRGDRYGTSIEPTELPTDCPIGEPMARSVSRSRLDIERQPILLGQPRYRPLLLPQMPKSWKRFGALGRGAQAQHLPSSIGSLSSPGPRRPLDQSLVKADKEQKRRGTGTSQAREDLTKPGDFKHFDCP